MRLLTSIHLAVLLSTLVCSSRAGVLFPDPPGGWTYQYDGNQLIVGAPGSGFTSLDGTWSHDNGSDTWDGSTLGGTYTNANTGDGFSGSNRPGGAATNNEAGVTFLRLQDPGDPRDYSGVLGFGGDPSNRKVYFGHDIGADGGSASQIQDGITLSFRARIPTAAKSTSPIDSLYRDGQSASGVQPYPVAGDGYVTSDGGKGQFVLHEMVGDAATGGTISFSLTQTNDTGSTSPNPANFAGLTMNEFNGNTVNNNVNFGQGTATNLIALDPTDWHEFWIVLKQDPANIGTHVAYIYVDGNLTPTVFKMTAGAADGSADYAALTFLGMGSTATPQNSALDVDFVAYKLGAVFPPGFADPTGGWTYKYDGNQLIVGAAGSGFTSLDGTWSHDNGSDTWDGSTLGGTYTNASTGDGFSGSNRPGGAATNSEAGVTFLRLQDPGDPRDYSGVLGFGGDPSNRKVYFGHDIGEDGGSASQIQDGITLSFRARIPTAAKSTSPLDSLYRDGQAAGGVQPYPVAGDGYVTSDGGKGQFVLHEMVGDAATGGTISFSLTQTNDTGSTSPNPANFAGLTMNEFNGNTVNNNVNFGQGTATNLIALDPTDWHAFWIVLKKDPANIGTHVAYIYVDGNLTPTVFKMTAGAADGSADYAARTFLGMGSTATPQNSALDVDFVAYKLGENYPGGALDNLPPELVSISPPYRKSFHPAAAGISVDAITQGINQLPTNGVTLTLNGVDVSSSVGMSGTPQARTITYSNLLVNIVYTGQMIVSDQEGRSATNDFLFDTFVEAQTTVLEAEDYNHSSGQFSNNPPAGAYSGLVGTLGVDYLDSSLGSVGIYRGSDTADTWATTDLTRDKFTAGGQTDYQLDVVTRGEWWNYTRTYTPGSYQAYLRAATMEDQRVRLDLVTSGSATANQTRLYLGTFRLANSGSLSAFGYGTLTDLQGNPVALPLDGTSTLRLTSLDGRLVGLLDSQGDNSSSSLALNYLVLSPVTTPTTPAVSAAPDAGETGVLPNAPIEATIIDGASPVNTGSVVLTVNGATVGATVAKVGNLTQVKYTPASLWAGGSSNVVNLSFNDGTPRSHTWGFTVALLPRLTPGMKVSNASSNGFVWRIFQNAGNVDTSLSRAEAALAGLLAPLGNEADPNAIGPASDLGEPASPGTGTMTFRIPTVINVNQNPFIFTLQGQGTFMPDDQMPGIPSSKNGIAAEVKTFLQLPAGVITMVVHSDDGFRTTAGFLNDAPLMLAQVDGPHEPAGDTLFRFVVQEAGVYAFRTIYYDGEREAALEWYTVNNDGVSLLVNDTANGGVAGFQEGTIPSAVQPTLTIQSIGGGQVTITWGANGTLQVADHVSGPYTDVTGATSPYTTAASGTRFYRVRIP